MDLRKYLDLYGNDTLRRVAKEAGTSYEYLRQLLYKQRRPSVELAEALVEATDGELDMISLLNTKRWDNKDYRKPEAEEEQAG